MRPLQYRLVKFLPGDITICYYCGVLLQFSDDMALIRLNKENYCNLDYETKSKILKAQQVIINLHLK